MTQPLLIAGPGPAELLALVSREGYELLGGPVRHQGRWVVAVSRPMAMTPSGFRHGLGTLGWCLVTLVLLAGASLLVGYWAVHGLPLMCALLVTAVIILALVIRRLR